MNRRIFLKSGACSLVALAGPPRFLVRTAAADARGKVLVAVFQRGAVDGLSMIVPYGDPAYATARPTIALKPPKRGEGDRALDLDGFFAMHPALAPLVPLWENRSLAVVHACGSPDTTRSHFDAQDYMESGTPGVKATPDGWLARAVKTLPAKPAPFRAVALGRALPRALQGDAGAIAMQSIDRFDMRAADTTARGGFEALYARSVSDVLSGTGYQTFEAMKMLQSANASRIPPANGAEYPRGQFGEAMRQVAQLIKANVGLEVAFADTQGWDTHVGQGAEQGQLAADGGRRRPDHVRVRPHGRRERQPRHRPRPRDRDAGPGRRRPRGPCLRSLARARAGAALRGSRPRGDDRLPHALQRGRRAPPRHPVGAAFSGLEGLPTAARPLRVALPRPGWFEGGHGGRDHGTTRHACAAPLRLGSIWGRGVRCAAGWPCVTVRASWATTSRSCATAHSRPSR